MFVLSPLREFSFIFRCKVCSAAGGNIKKLAILILLILIFVKASLKQQNQDIKDKVDPLSKEIAQLKE